MSSFEFTDAATWADRPIARQVADARARARVVVTGIIRAAQVVNRASSPAFCCTLDDGTGQLDLVFLGRRSVAGLAVGTRCRVEGTAQSEGNGLVIWNPLYRLEEPDPVCEHDPASPSATEDPGPSTGRSPTTERAPTATDSGATSTGHQ
jgi:RecG-like helicase